MTAAWIEQLIQGDTVAWTQFIDHFGTLIRSRVADVAVSMGRAQDWSTIDDVTAEVFASLIANNSAALRAFRHRSSLGTYLAVIATRVARRVIGKIIGNEISVDPVDIVDPASECTATPEQSAISKEQQEQLLSFVDQLPPAWRQLVVSHYREGMTYQQISEAFNVPVGTIGTTLRRAENRLRNWIDGGNSS